MAQDVFSWQTGNRYLSELGGEDHLAARIEAERLARNWSQSELARQMANIGHPIPQTAISKIENPQKGGRRAISVDELIAFGKVFHIPVGELVLPANVLRSVKARQAIGEGPEALRAKLRAESRYDTILRDIAVAAIDDAQLWEILTVMRDRFEAQRFGPGPSEANDRPFFILDVFRAIDSERERRNGTQRPAPDEVPS